MMPRSAALAVLGFLAVQEARTAEPVKLRPIVSVLADSKGDGLSRPEGVACDGKSLVVADTGNGRLVRYDTAGDDVSPKDEIVLPEVTYPIRVELDGAGGFYVLDGKTRRIARVGSDGGLSGFVAPEAGPPPAPVVPRSVRVGPGGELHVLDIASARVLVVDRSGKTVRQVGYPEGTGFVSDVAVDAAGRIFLVDSVGSRLLVADKGATTAGPLTGILREDLDFAVAITVDPMGRLFVADQNGGGIVIFGQDGAFLGRQAGVGWGDGELRYPASLCADGKGRLWVADRENDRVQGFVVTP